MRTTLITSVAAAIGLVAAFFLVAYLWQQSGVHMTMHGWIAYALGCLFSLALAGGLFYLTFKSAREGYDDIDRPEDYEE